MLRTKILPQSAGSETADNLARDIKESGKILVVCHQLMSGDYEVKWYDGMTEPDEGRQEAREALSRRKVR